MGSKGVLGYDLLSLSYDELYGGEQIRKYRAAVCYVEVSGVGRILDVGCGTALLYSFLRDIGLDGEYVGVDISAGILEKARHRGAPHLVQADGHRLPFRSTAFTHTLSFTVVHHCNPPKILEEALRTTSRQVVISQNRRLAPRLSITPVAEVGDEEILVINIQS
ncbi:Ubiquinone/menaquinone biosynthesis C-methyltransferase UbiE [archaeon HR01]|nr:Ubiquinone/menaquinone biosynthesis C-methyltransferase UbiE [archaeon HR01]